MVDLVAQSGLIESVWTQNAGVVLATDAAAGDTVLDVESTDILETETGAGQVQIGATVYDYTVDPDALTVTLGSTLDADAVEGTRIESYPLAPVTLARVSLDTGDAATVRVAAAHVLLLSDGDRNGSEREYVTLYREGSNYVTLDVPNATATVKGGRIDDSAGDLDPSADVVFLDGPPTHYMRDSDAAILTRSEMEAEADPAWVAVMDTLDADNGTVVFQSADPGFMADVYYPAWMLSNGGGEFRVHVDDVSWDGDFSGVLVAGVSIAPLMTDGVTIPTGGSSSPYTLDQFAAGYLTPVADPVANLFGWYYYEGLHHPGDPMPSVGPAMSNTPAETLEYSPTFLGQGLPNVLLIFTEPFSLDYAGGGWTTQAVTVTGVRVVRE